MIATTKYKDQVRSASAYLASGLDVCPPFQEDLDGPEVTFLSSTVEGSPSILSERQRDKCKTDTWNTTNSIDTTQTYMHTHIDTYIHTFIHTYTHKYIHTYIHLHTYKMCEL